MNPLRPAIAAAVAIVLLFAYLWDLRRTETAALQAMQDERVLFLLPSLVHEITFHGDDGPIRAVHDRASGSWTIEEPRRLVANEVVIEAFLENLRGARRHALVDNRTPGEVGLDDPRRAVTVTFEHERTGEKVTRTLQFGDQPDDHSRIYARVLEDEHIFTVSDWLYRQAGKSLQDVRSTVVFDDEIATADRFDVHQRRGTFTLHRQDRSGLSWTIERAGLDPVPVDRAIMDRLLSNLSDARYLQIHDEVTSTTAELGLEPPLVELLADGGTVLSVGKRIEEAEQFLVAGPGGTIGVLPGSQVVDLLRPPVEWATKRFTWIPREEIRTIHSSLGNTRYTLEREEPGDEWFFTEMPGVPVRQSAVADFLEGMESFRGLQLVQPSLAEEEMLRFGLHSESYRVVVTSADGEEQGFHFGRVDTREGNTYVLRLQDRSLWAVTARSQPLVYRYRRDFEERRLAPGLPDRTDHVEIVTPHGEMTFQRTQAAWRVTMPGERPTLVPPILVRSFLQSFEEMEAESEMFSQDEYPAEMTFRFYEEAARDPFLTAGVLMRSRSGNTILRIGERTVEVGADQIDHMDEALTDLLMGAKAHADQARQQ